MGIFNTIRKAFRKGEALPNEHGPAVRFAKQRSDAENTRIMADIINSPDAKKSKKLKNVTKVEFIKATTDDKPTTIPSEYAKAVVAKQKAATKAKPSKDSENKKAPAKKAPVKKAPAKAPAKKSTPKKK